MPDPVRFGVVGVGGVGGGHCRRIAEQGKHILAAVCDTVKCVASDVGQKYDVPYFTDAERMYESGLIDAVVIATPHPSHPPLAITAFSRRLHTLVEKPVAVRTSDAEAINAAADEANSDGNGVLYSAMFNQRADPTKRRMHEIIASGQLGPIRRVRFIATQWYRTQSYYDSGTWRGTWKGEGGGALMNQGVHDLDLMTWVTGMPRRVTAIVCIGRGHRLETDDDSTAILEYDNGAVGLFQISTCDKPGRYSFEVLCDRGTVRLEDGQLKMWTLSAPLDKFTRSPGTDKRGIEAAEADPDVPEMPPDWPGAHGWVLTNFGDAIRGQDELFIDGRSGLQSIELINAILYSGLRREPVELPLDRAAYNAFLDDLIAKSRA